MLILNTSILYAENSTIQPIVVNEDETQLAKVFKKREAVEERFEYSLKVGYRKDSVNWSISGNSRDLLSELTWENMSIYQARLSGRVNLHRGWFLYGEFSSGTINSGQNRDSDYAESNGNKEYSRSVSSAGGAVSDIKFFVGKSLFEFSRLKRSISVTPLVGLSINQQRLTMYNGSQVIPYDAPLIGLNNNYDAQWYGPFVGATSIFEINKNINFHASIEYYRFKYSAEANWNLREDFKHPRSFEHKAEGKGIVYALGLDIVISRNLLITSKYEYRAWDTDSGNDTTYYSYGTTDQFKLNQVEWRSYSLSIGTTYLF